MQPLVYGRAVNVNPLVTIVSLLVGAELLGILGVLLAIPTALPPSRSSSVSGGRQRASGLRVSALTRGQRAPTRTLALIGQSSGTARRAMIIQRLTIRPSTPTTIRIIPMVEILMPATWAVTANFRMAPRAIVNKLSPRFIG
ncbi:MAG: AI-2E family transporter [Solirubrobacterales bacterium]|nr:AI-2E family transporter [Solirubrobacterales bacterium]